MFIVNAKDGIATSLDEMNPFLGLKHPSVLLALFWWER